MCDMLPLEVRVRFKGEPQSKERAVKTPLLIEPGPRRK